MGYKQKITERKAIFLHFQMGFFLIFLNCLSKISCHGNINVNQH